MSQQDVKLTPWILVSSVKDDTNPQDVERITPQISGLIDDWHSSGRMMWSGGLDDEKTGIAVFEGTKQEADELYKKYDKICSGILNYYLYQWDAMPILSILQNNS
ncbi:MAG: hypothetical protein GWN01_03580 [Nitrosopumilaceae archaeon]|nr:hypothetical protein [Nitrosopumilaceae archaeon]NIU00039.1 hypothetical protein [Nitrosopumilaceae archaeon]NIU86418.1 hypothetical protein [Nitrosopumilaceae archaeon]NIV65127.1 hypothetical protein [Nitrosopumilaceae archaeon]NIX60641.1 hypothetical protein [Nitrosopumilaceae archaeon]